MCRRVYYLESPPPLYPARTSSRLVIGCHILARLLLLPAIKAVICDRKSLGDIQLALNVTLKYAPKMDETVINNMPSAFSGCPSFMRACYKRCNIRRKDFVACVKHEFLTFGNIRTHYKVNTEVSRISVSASFFREGLQ
jgi:hypothetical protein